MRLHPLLAAAPLLLLAALPAHAEGDYDRCEYLQTSQQGLVSLSAAQVKAMQSHLDGLMQQVRTAFPGYVFKPLVPDRLRDGSDGIGTEQVVLARRDYQGYWVTHHACEPGMPLRSEFNLELQMAAPGTQAAAQFERERREQDGERQVASLQDQQAQIGEKIGLAYQRGDMNEAARLQQQLMQLNQQTMVQLGQPSSPTDLAGIQQAVRDQDALSQRVARDTVGLRIHGGERGAVVGRGLKAKPAPEGVVALLPAPVYEAGTINERQEVYLLLGSFAHDPELGDYANSDRQLSSLPPADPQRSLMLTLMGRAAVIDAAVRTMKAPAFGLPPQPLTAFSASPASSSGAAEKAGTAGKKVLDKALGKLFGG